MHAVWQLFWFLILSDIQNRSQKSTIVQFSVSNSSCWCHKSTHANKWQQPRSNHRCSRRRRHYFWNTTVTNRRDWLHIKHIPSIVHNDSDKRTTFWKWQNNKTTKQCWIKGVHYKKTPSTDPTKTNEVCSLLRLPYIICCHHDTNLLGNSLLRTSLL